MDYNISLGVILEQDDLQRIRAQINRLELDPIRIQLDTGSIQSQINNIRAQLQGLGTIGINLGATSGAGGISGATGGLRNLARSADDVNRVYRELISLQNRIGSKQQTVAKLDTTHNQREIMELSTQIDNLFGRYQRLHSMFAGSFSTGQVDNLNRGFQITSERLSIVNQKIADVRANLATGIQGNFGNYETQLMGLETRFNSLTNKTPQLRMGIDAVKQALATLKSADGTEALISANREYQSVLQQVEAQLRQVEAVERSQNSSIALLQGKEQALLRLNGLFENNSAAAKRFSGEVQILKSRINECGNTAGLKQINRDISILSGKIKEAGLQTQTLATRFKAQLSQYSMYFSGYMLFMYAFQGLRSMFEQVKSIDSAMTELKKVTNETDAAYSRFLSNAASRSKELGTTIDGLISSTADFARLGYSFKDAQGLAEVANIYAVVGDEIEGVEQATESLISTMAAFKDEASEMSNTDFAMSIIDKFNEVGKLIA